MSTYHIISTPPDCTTFSWMMDPFMPQVQSNGVSAEAVKRFDVKFNQGYIFDYAQAGKRIGVTGLEQQISEAPETFALKIEFDHQNGEVLGAGIEKGNTKDSTFDNFCAQSDIAGEEMETGQELVSPAEYYLDLAKFDGGCIEELYIRENIHLHLRGHYQKFDEYEMDGEIDGQSGGVGVGHGVMNPTGSVLPNGDIEYRALCADPRTGNILEISTSGNNIYFFAQSSSELDGGEPPGGG